MTTEVLAVDSLSAVRLLWSQRWTLLAAVAIASGLGYAVTFALPATWESQAVVQLGQVGTNPIESVVIIVRRINVGTLTCDPSSDVSSPGFDAVTGQVDAADAREIRFIARGRSLDEAVRRANDSAACLVRRHQKQFESAVRRDSEYRAALYSQVAQLKENIANITQMVARSTNSSNQAENLLLVTRLADERARLIDLAAQVHTFDEEHAADTPTTVISSPSRPVAPIWPRRGLLAALGGAVALVLACSWVLFGPAVGFSAPE
jgi:uncharacterized protein involved in exopolysaccharide biosynthesis